MSTLLCDQEFVKTENSRKRMIDALRSALNSAESGESEVTINFDNLEITWNYKDCEFFVIG